MTSEGLGDASPDDVAAITDALYDRDIDAFVRGDWALVADDFAPGAFVGYHGGLGAGDPWTIGFPTLEAYRDDWLRQSAALRAGVAAGELRAQLRAASRIARIEARGDRAITRKEFDGEAGPADRRQRLHWLTYYFLRRDADRWRVTGFVGYLPLEGRGRP